MCYRSYGGPRVSQQSKGGIGGPVWKKLRRRFFASHRIASTATKSRKGGLGGRGGGCKLAGEDFYKSESFGLATIVAISAFIQALAS